MTPDLQRPGWTASEAHFLALFFGVVSTAITGDANWPTVVCLVALGQVVAAYMLRRTFFKMPEARNQDGSQPVQTVIEGPAPTPRSPADASSDVRR